MHVRSEPSGWAVSLAIKWLRFHSLVEYSAIRRLCHQFRDTCRGAKCILDICACGYSQQPALYREHVNLRASLSGHCGIGCNDFKAGYWWQVWRMHPVIVRLSSSTKMHLCLYSISRRRFLIASLHDCLSASGPSSLNRYYMNLLGDAEWWRNQDIQLGCLDVILWSIW